MNEKQSLYIGVDLGGTNTVAALVADGGEIIAQVRRATKQRQAAMEVVDDLCRLISHLLAQAACEPAAVGGIGIGTPGAANTDTGVVDFASSFPFDRFPLGPAVAARLGVPTWILNDADAAALGEWRFGPHGSCSSFALVTLGTGIGCGLILGNALYTGTNFSAGELGHMVVQPDGAPCACGRSGCFEQYGSATGLIRMTKEKMAQAPDSLLWTLCGGVLENVTGKTAFDGLRAGDKTAETVVLEYVHWLALGLTNLVNLFQPDVLCIGGGLSHEGETLLAPLRDLIARQDYARFCKKRTKLVAAALKNDAGLLGAAFLANQRGERAALI